MNKDPIFSYLLVAFLFFPSFDELYAASLTDEIRRALQYQCGTPECLNNAYKMAYAHPECLNEILLTPYRPEAPNDGARSHAFDILKSLAEKEKYDISTYFNLELKVIKEVSLFSRPGMEDQRKRAGYFRISRFGVGAFSKKPKKTAKENFLSFGSLVSGPSPLYFIKPTAQKVEDFPNWLADDDVAWKGSNL